MKRALILSGGGAHGAWQAGVIEALVESGKTYDLIIGVSVGAINGMCLSMFPPEKQKEGASLLSRLWAEEIKGNSSIYVPWYFFPFNYLASLWKGSLNDQTPLRKILEKQFDKEKMKNSGVEFRAGAVSLTSGAYKCGTSKNEDDLNKMIDWVMASAAMPEVFQPIELNNEMWVDGGVRNITPISDIVLENPEVEEIDVVVIGTLKKMSPNIKNYRNILNVSIRCLGIAVDEIYRTDLDYCNELGKKVNINKFFLKEDLNYDSFDFNPSNLISAFEMGYKDTKNIL